MPNDKPETTEIEESEFGKGYAYCLGLFLAHEWKMFSDKSKAKEWAEKHPGDIQVYKASSWFNGAADHLFELEIPDALPDEKKKQVAAFRDRCLGFRLCMNGERCDWDDATKALDEAKDLLREWDEFNKIPSMKGSWQ